jgi:hypothetical protein
VDQFRHGGLILLAGEGGDRGKEVPKEWGKMLAKKVGKREDYMNNMNPTDIVSLPIIM